MNYYSDRDLERAYNKMKDIHHYTPQWWLRSSYVNDFIKLLKESPTILAPEAEWQPYNINGDDISYEPSNSYICSNCSVVWELSEGGTPYDHNMNFCPCCGSKMRWENK